MCEDCKDKGCDTQESPDNKTWGYLKECDHCYFTNYIECFCTCHELKPAR